MNGWSETKVRQAALGQVGELRILVVGARAGEQRALQEHLEAFSTAEPARMVRAASCEVGLERLDEAEGAAVCILSCRLGERGVLKFLRHLRAWGEPAPAILLARREDEDLLVKGLHEGACDYLLEEELDLERTFRSVRFAVELGRQRAARRQAERRLQEVERRLRVTSNVAAEGLLTLDREARITACNDGAHRILGRSADELVGRSLREVEWRAVHEDGTAFLHESWPALATLANGEPRTGVLMGLERPDGREIWVTVNSLPLYDAASEAPVGAVVALTDVTESRNLGAQLQEAHKLEVVGRLTGSIAHDFNNLLTAILGYGEFLLRDLSPTDSRRRSAEEVQKSARRAVALTSQLLSFSRRRQPAPEAVEVDAVLGDLRGLLERLIGHDVVLDIAPSAAGCRAWADAAELEQVVMNLVVNARDAMPRGGTLTVRTRREGGTRLARGPRPAEEEPVRLALEVTDTGVGMDASTRARVFDAFFTTKEPGKGTGLGLHIVQTIVQRLGGRVAIDSQLGKGTTVSVLLPVVEISTEAPAEA